MKGLKGILEADENKMSSFWGASEEESYSNPKHPQLRIICTDIPIYSSVEMLSGKFPNLVELRLGAVHGISLDQFLNFVQSTHPKLQRLSWICMREMFRLEELFRHLIRVQEQLPELNNYSLRSNYKVFVDVDWPDRIQDMEELANILLSLPSKSDSALVINLLIKSFPCDCIVRKDEPPTNDCQQCYLQQFIRSQDLPIRIHSVQEIEEMERKYQWNHRFAGTWIYK
jgi:hypothetical protein